MEIRLKPCDAFDWDEKMVSKRLQLAKRFYVLSKEDYILTKLSRMDCSSTDLQDIIQIIINNIDIIDQDYLITRLKQFNKINEFKDLFKQIIMEIRPDQIPRLNDFQKKIEKATSI
jgi:hypothetical protein